MIDSTGSYFINGKSQVIEMLKIMPIAERNKLLENIKKRNPTLANELAEKSISFDAVFTLNRRQYEIFFRSIRPAVLGIALKDSAIDNQRRILMSSPRAFAEEAYTTMSTLIDNEKQAIGKAQNKVVEILTELFSKKIFRDL